MNDELRAAAERLRKLDRGRQSYHETYGCEESLGGHRLRDERKIIDAYLDEHPADEYEPIRNGLLDRYGFLVIGDEEIVWEIKDENNMVFLSRDCRGRWLANGRELPERAQPKTVGQLRLLCLALGITVKE